MTTREEENESFSPPSTSDNSITEWTDGSQRPGPATTSTVRRVNDNHSGSSRSNDPPCMRIPLPDFVPSSTRGSGDSTLSDDDEGANSEGDEPEILVFPNNADVGITSASIPTENRTVEAPEAEIPVLPLNEGPTTISAAASLGAPKNKSRPLYPKHGSPTTDNLGDEASSKGKDEPKTRGLTGAAGIASSSSPTTRTMETPTPASGLPTTHYNKLENNGSNASEAIASDSIQVRLQKDVGLRYKKQTTTESSSLQDETKQSSPQRGLRRAPEELAAKGVRRVAEIPEPSSLLEDPEPLSPQKPNRGLQRTPEEMTAKGLRQDTTAPNAKEQRAARMVVFRGLRKNNPAQHAPMDVEAQQAGPSGCNWEFQSLPPNLATEHQEQEDDQENQTTCDGPQLGQSNTLPTGPNAGLVVARLVVEEQHIVRAQRIDDTELEHQIIREQKENRFRKVGFAIILVSTAFAIAMAVGFSSRKVQPEPTVAPISPTVAPTSVIDGNLLLLQMDLPECSRRSIQNSSTPQWKAWQWLPRFQNFTNYPLWRQKQLFALATFYYSFDGDHWPEDIRSNWMLEDRDECYWFSSVFGWFGYGGEQYWEFSEEDKNDPCHSVTNKFGALVIHNLQLSNLKPAVPPEIALLTSLSDLRLSWNNISAPLTDMMPTELWQLTNLRVLMLNANSLTGEIPSELGLLTSMTELVLAGNLLSGSIPSELGQLTNSNTLSLRVNSLTGWLPTELGNLGAMTSLEQDRNSLTGPIPSEFGLMTVMTHLSLWGNSFTGGIPLELQMLTAMRTLWLSENALTGPIPRELSSLSSIYSLYLDDNLLTGFIPREISMLTSIIELSLFGNSLTGTLPSEIGLLRKLGALYLNENLFTGGIPRELAYPKHLRRLFLDTNSLSGLIPSEFAELTLLKDLLLWDNALSGAVPTELGMMTSMELLSLSKNFLSGLIPSEFAELTLLKDLRLWDNTLSGAVPTELGMMTSMELLSISENFLTGAIPSEVGVLSAITTLHVRSNYLSGPLPSEFTMMTTLISLSMRSNNLSGPLAMDIASMSSMKRLWAQENSFSGRIPSGFDALSNLTSLRLQFNGFSGRIPVELLQLPNLQELDLSGLPLLNGSIPFAKLSNSSLGYLNFTGSSRLLGTIPGELCHLQHDSCYFEMDGDPKGCALDFDCSTQLCGCDCPCSNAAL